MGRINVTANLGHFIREARTAKGMTQAEVAKAIGFQSSQFIYMIEKNTSKAPLNVLGRLIVVLEMKESVVMDILVAEFLRTATLEVLEGKRAARKRKI